MTQSINSYSTYIVTSTTCISTFGGFSSVRNSNVCTQSSTTSQASTRSDVTCILNDSTRSNTRILDNASSCSIINSQISVSRGSCTRSNSTININVYGSPFSSATTFILDTDNHVTCFQCYTINSSSTCNSNISITYGSISRKSFNSTISSISTFETHSIISCELVINFGNYETSSSNLSSISSSGSSRSSWSTSQCRRCQRSFQIKCTLKTCNIINFVSMICKSGINSNCFRKISRNSTSYSTSQINSLGILKFSSGSSITSYISLSGVNVVCSCEISRRTSSSSTSNNRSSFCSLRNIYRNSRRTIKALTIFCSGESKGILQLVSLKCTCQTNMKCFIFFAYSYRNVTITCYFQGCCLRISYNTFFSNLYCSECILVNFSTISYIQHTKQCSLIQLSYSTSSGSTQYSTTFSYNILKFSVSNGIVIYCCYSVSESQITTSFSMTSSSTSQKSSMFSKTFTSFCNQCSQFRKIGFCCKYFIASLTS